MTMGVWYPYCPCWMVISDTADTICLPTQRKQSQVAGHFTRDWSCWNLYSFHFGCVCVLNHRPYPTNAAQCQPAQVYYTHMLYHPAITHGHMAMKIGDFPIQIYHWDFPAGHFLITWEWPAKATAKKDTLRCGKMSAFPRILEKILYLPFYLLHISQDLPLFTTLSFLAGWWFGTFFLFHNIWDNPVILPID